MRLPSLALAAFVLVARPALACSAFLMDAPDGPVVGKSYDWSDERGLVIVNMRGVEKRALVLTPDAVPAVWRSRFGSLSFNQYGRELPNGGINEAGVVVEVLILEESRFPGPDSRPVLTELGLVQYLLDQAASTSEAIKLAQGVRITPAYARIHYFVCDPGGACATLELLGGELVVTTGEAMPVRGITNSSYAASIAALGRSEPRKSSLGRFTHLADALRVPVRGEPVKAGFSLLESVRFDSTQWNIVYELKTRRVHFRSRRHAGIKSVSLAALAADCTTPALTLDLRWDKAGDAAAHFVPYRPETNEALVSATLAPIAAQLPPGLAGRVAAYPETLSCGLAAPPSP